jgi:hypothetical protein
MRAGRKAFYTLLPCIVSRPQLPLPLPALAAVALADDAQRMQQGEPTAPSGNADGDAEAADWEADRDRVRRPLRLRTALSAAMGAMRHSIGSGSSELAVSARYLAAEALVRLAAEEAEGIPLEDADRSGGGDKPSGACDGGGRDAHSAPAGRELRCQGARIGWCLQLLLC